MAEPLRLEGLQIKKEVTYGVDPTPGATDAIRVVGRVWEMLNPDHVMPNRRDDVVWNTIRPGRAGIPSGRTCELTGPWELKGKGSAYAASTDVEVDPVLQACGYSVAVDTTPSAEKITYTPADSGLPSAYGYAFGGGLRYTLGGIRGNFRWPLEPGGLGHMDFTLRGLMPTAPTQLVVPTHTYDSQLPPRAVGLTLTVGAYAPVVARSVEFDAGNQVETIEDAQGADGIDRIDIPEASPKLVIVVEKEALATYDPFADLAARTSRAIDFTIGGTQYNRCKMSATEAYISREPENVNEKGFAGWRLTYDIVLHTIVFD